MRKFCDPTEISPWGCYEVITRDLIEKCIIDRLFKDQPVHNEEWEDPIAHAQRIAYFVWGGWSDAIEVDIGIPDMGCTVKWPITDGNHRFSAAIFLEKPWIMADLSGSLDFAEEIGLISRSRV